MTTIEIKTLRRILTEIKEAATNFGDTPAELINRLCDANYLAERGVKLIDKAEVASMRIGNFSGDDFADMGADAHRKVQS